MTISNRLLAGTALCLLMAVPAGARAETGTELPPLANDTPIILAQAEEPGAEQEPGADCPEGTVLQEGECVVVEDAVPPEEVPPEEAPPEAEEPAPEPSPAEPKEPAEPAPTDEVAPEQPAEPTAEPEAPADEQPLEAAPEPEAEPAVEPRAEEPPVTEEPSPDEPAAEEVQPLEEAVEPEEQPVEQQQPATEEAPAEEIPADEPEQPAEMDEPAAPGVEGQAIEEEAPVTDECPEGTRMSATEGACVPIEEEVQPTEEAPAKEAPAEEAPVEEAPAEEVPAEEAPAEEPEEPVDGAAPDAEQPAQRPAAEEPPAEEPEGEVEPQEGEVLQEAAPEDAAPVLDSQKEEGAVTPEEPTPEAAEEQPVEGEQPPEQAEETVVPESDEQAQEDVVDPEQVRQEIRALIQEEGQRIELGQTPEDQQVRRQEMFQLHEDARVIEQYNDNRVIVEINNEIFVESPDYDRLVLRGDLVYYEELSGGRVREVIEREDGTRVITVRNRYGDILRRVRVTPDGREYLLAYLPEERYDTVLHFEDPALDLPPLRLTIPVSEYILEAETVDDPDVYYTFLSQPPVEPVQRLYSIEEVQYSARVRDMVRRIDLDTIEFEFGSARIEESEIADLEAVAAAIERMLEENPAETFLIEGHTDAVGSEVANLALSDRRAEAVARALTAVFGLPPENLVTQGYGERYLKVNTQEPERENRRVAIRRITPLVAPVAARQ